MLIDATKPPIPEYTEASAVAKPFRPIVQLSQFRPWNDVIRDFNKLSPEAFAKTNRTPFSGFENALHPVISTATHRIVTYLIMDSGVRLAGEKGLTDSSQIKPEYLAQFLDSPDLWFQASTEAILLTVHGALMELDCLPYSITFPTWQAWERNAVIHRPGSRDALMSVQYPALSKRPIFSTGEPVELVWMSYDESDDFCELTAFSKIADADQRVRSLSFEIAWEDFDDPEAVVESAIIRAGGPTSVHADVVEKDALAFQPWIESYFSAFASARLGASTKVDLSLLRPSDSKTPLTSTGGAYGKGPPLDGYPIAIL